MNRFLLLLPVLALPVFADQGDHPDAKPSTPEEERTKFHLPPGFEIQLVAAEPAIQKPFNLNFDAAGRLWVTGSEAYPWPAGTDAQGKAIPNYEKAYDEIAGAFGARGKAPAPTPNARDTVRVLSDFADDGHAKNITIFADKLNIPTGVQPLPRRAGAKGDTVIVYSIPNIYRLEDTDGDGTADKRELLYGTAGYIDTHGGLSSFLYWIDGWIYGTHGFRNHTEITDRAGRKIAFDSGNTYRFRPDGSAFEIYTHGQTNPFGLTVDPYGNFYSSDSHSKPIYLLLRGGYYEGIGKDHDGLGFAPWITTDGHDSTSIAGNTFYAADQFPQEFRGNTFNGNPVTQRINRDRLEWHGSTPQAVRMPDFLTSDDPWFRPVNIKLGPDGALYIADFYNCIIGHYEFPLADPRRDHTHGRIWRIVWRGEKKELQLPEMPNFSKEDAAGLVKKLDDSNLTVRTLATNELTDRIGKDAASALRPLPGNEFARAHALWALTRIDALDVDTVSNAWKDNSSVVRAHISQILPLARKPNGPLPILGENFYGGVIGALDKDARVVRFNAANLVAASSKGLSPLLKTWETAAKDDSELIYTARMGLRDILLMPDGYAAAAKFAEGDVAAAEKIADVSLGAKTPEAAEFLLGHLARTKFASPRAGEYLRHAALNIAPERMSAVAALFDQLNDAPLAQRLAVADGIGQAARQRGLALPETATAFATRTFTEALRDKDPAILDKAIAAVRETQFPEKMRALVPIISDAQGHGPRRAAALEALMNVPMASFTAAKALADPSSMTLRKKAAELLGASAANNASPTSLADRSALTNALLTAPAELATLIATGLVRTDEGTDDLLKTIESGKATAGLLRQAAVAAALEKRPQPLRDRVAALTKDLPPEDARLDAVIAKRVEEFRAAKPDAAHGKQIYTQTCAVCHKLKNEGGNIGPALDGVGARGVHRLCEDILDPNRNVDPIFRQTVVETTDGQTLAGLNARVEGELFTLTDATGKTVSVPKASVKSQTVSRLSLMLPTFEQTLPAADFNDLLAFLLAPPQ